MQYEKANMEIRKKKNGIPNWVVAEKLGVHEMTFIRWMRTEMSDKRKGDVLDAIYLIKKGGN